MGYIGAQLGQHAGRAAGGTLGRKLGGAIGHKVGGEHGKHVGKHAGHKVGSAAGAAGGKALGELLPFDKGGKVVKTTPALLHKSEVVVPSKYAKHVGTDLKQKTKQNGGHNM